ncbi:MAG: carotenoid biosynthesis protein [Pseudobdellovibrio sp.]
MTKFKITAPILSYFLFLSLLVAMGVSSLNITTETLFIVSVVMFMTCSVSATHLFGLKTASKFIALALAIGFFAEYMGETYGWFFGEYTFTDALGLRLLGVPVVIPLMWFNLSYICYVLGNIILNRTPINPSNRISKIIVSAFFSSILVAAYDLAADPYMVFVIKAWVMKKTDGWWFGETIQGFFGWTFIAFIINLSFSLIVRTKQRNPPENFKKIHALIPIWIFFCWMVFQMMYGSPIETRIVSFFAMGIPLMVALFSWDNWSWNSIKGSN